MSTVSIPQEQWSEFLQGFTRRHRGWLVTLETQDLKTDEAVVSRFMPLQAIELDLEDQKNPRINVTLLSEDKEIKHIFFRPSRLVLYLSPDTAVDGVHIDSINTSTTVRFRIAARTELVDGVA